MKKFLTFVLVLAMVLSVSSFAMAAEVADAAALQTAVNDGGDVKLSADITLTETLIIPAGVSVTLDLNGKTISGTHGADYSMIHVLNGAELTVKDTSDEQNGKITCAAGGNNIGANVWVEGKLVLESGTIEITGSWSLGFAVDLRPNAWGTPHTVGASFVMKGGMVKATDTAVRVASNSSDSHQELGVTFTMNGGVIESDWDAIFVQHLYNGDLDINVKAGTVSGSNSAMRIYGDNAGSDIDMIVEDGEFTGAIKIADAYATAEDVIVISGGTFSEDPSAYLAADYVVSKDANGNYVPAEATEVNVPSDGTDATATPNTGEIVKITKEQVEALANEKSLVVTADGMDFTFSKELLSGLLGENGSYVAIKIKKIAQTELNEAQQKAIESTAAQLVFTAEIYVNGEYVGDKLGDMKVQVLITRSSISANTPSLDGYSLVYISDDGKLEIIANAEAGANVIKAELPHFSEYAVIKTEDANNIIASQKAPATSSSGSGYSGPDVWYIGGNTFGTNTNQVPTSVEIDQVPVSFTMNGGQITVDCITPGANWVKVSWGSTTNTRYFTPDANAYCAQAVIPKTGDMSFWAAVAAFFGF